MRRWVALYIVAEAMVVVVLLPVAVNVATGGSVPPGFGGIRPFAWDIVVGLAVIAVIIPLGRFLKESKVVESFHYSIFHLEKQHARILSMLTQEVTRDMRKSLEHLPWLPPTLTVVPGAVRTSDEIIPAEPSESGLSDIQHAFERFDRSLLILGNPGAGKSTLLLELARALLAEATEQDPPVPVLLNLARWRPPPDDARWRWARRLLGIPTTRAEHFVQWCVSEIAVRHGIPRPLARNWLVNDAVVLLLDGLDEMPEQDRHGFVTALDEAQHQRSPFAMVVTCRTADYNGVRPLLNVEGAVQIEPLDAATIDSFLTVHYALLSDLQDELNADDALRGLVDTPLLLALLAAQVRAGDLAAPVTSRSRLLERYVNIALSSRPFPARASVELAVLRQWLATVARAATPTGQLRWSNTWGASQSQALASAALPGFVVGSVCALFSASLRISFPAVALIGIGVLFAAFGTGKVLSLRFELGNVASWGWALAGIVAGLGVGGLAAAWLVGLDSNHLLHVPFAADWWIMDPLVTIPFYSLHYQAFRAYEEEYVDIKAENRRYEHMAMTMGPGKARVLASGKSTSEGRAGTNSVYAAAMYLFAALPILLIGGTVDAVALGFAAGLVLEFGAATARRVAGLPASHPMAALVEILPVPFLVIPFLLFLGLCPLLSPSLRSPYLLFLHHTAVSTRWPFELLSIFTGFLAGLVIGFRLIRWNKIGSRVSSAIAWSWLISTRRLPWRMGRYLAFIAGSGIARDYRDHIEFRHELLADHLRKPTATA